MKLTKYIPLVALFISSALSAEIQEVTLLWQPGLCGDKCIQELNRQLSKIPGVAAVRLDEGTGRAFLTWKPNSVFAFQPINAAVRYVGIRVNDIRLKVRGELVDDRGTIKLISSGDRTPFILINSAIPQQGAYTETHNPSVRNLSPELRNQFLEAIKQKSIVTIDGPFFEPYRSPPNLISVEHVTIDPPKDTPKRR